MIKLFVCQPMIQDICIQQILQTLKTTIDQKLHTFFQVYKDLEGKKVDILGWKSAKEAKEVVIESIKRYKNTLKKF